MEKAYFTGPFAPLCEAFVTQKRATGAIYDMDDKGNGTKERRRKKSFYWYKKVIASNGTDLE